MSSCYRASFFVLLLSGFGYCFDSFGDRAAEVLPFSQHAKRRRELSSYAKAAGFSVPPGPLYARGRNFRCFQDEGLPVIHYGSGIPYRFATWGKPHTPEPYLFLIRIFF